MIDNNDVCGIDENNNFLRNAGIISIYLFANITNIVIGMYMIYNMNIYK